MATYYQKVYDQGSSQWCYYSDTVINPTPLSGDTSPNYVGPITQHCVIRVVADEGASNLQGAYDGGEEVEVALDTPVLVQTTTVAHAEPLLRLRDARVGDNPAIPLLTLSEYSGLSLVDRMQLRPSMITGETKIEIVPSDQPDTDTTGYEVTITGGYGNGTGNGGDVEIWGGASLDGVGGDIYISGGTSSIEGVLTGTVTIEGLTISSDGAWGHTGAFTVGGSPVLTDADFADTYEGVMRRTGSSTYLVARHNLTAAVPPSVTDDETAGYAVGSIWLDPGSGIYYCVSPSTGAALWVRLAVGSEIPTVPDLSNADPQPLGTASAGVSDEVSRADHVHALPTTMSATIGTTIETTTVSFEDLTDGYVYQVNLGPSDTLSVNVGDSGATAGKLVGFVPVGTGGVQVIAAGSMNVRVNSSFLAEAAGQYSPIYVLILSATESLVFGDLAAA